MFLGFGSPLTPGKQVPHGTAVALVNDGHPSTRCVSCNTTLHKLDQCDNCSNGEARVLRYLIADADGLPKGWRQQIAPSGHLTYLGTAHYDYAWLMRKPRWNCPLTRLPRRMAWRPLIETARADRQSQKGLDRRYGR